MGQRGKRQLDMEGHVYGCWTVLSRANNNKHGQTCWNCQCTCGNEQVKPAHTLIARAKKVVGCRKCRWPNSGKGKYRKCDGYVMKKVPDHPNANSRQEVREHRLVMEDHLGRYLTKDERIHHKNGIRNDNRIGNLELWAGIHPYGQRASDLVKFAHEILERYGGTIFEEGKP